MGTSFYITIKQVWLLCRDGDKPFPTRQRHKPMHVLIDWCRVKSLRSVSFFFYYPLICNSAPGWCHFLESVRDSMDLHFETKHFFGLFLDYYWFSGFSKFYCFSMNMHVTVLLVILQLHLLDWCTTANTAFYGSEDWNLTDESLLIL